ncbi:phenylacetate-CoA oxygenase subunit PaaJ, partial [Saprospiraceae bacterium]|nr:phenylacetate-CoA oxygenase subunit PaaJ [Saprospiraceae bacterium]
MVAKEDYTEKTLFDIMKTVLDPEVPVLSIVELGIVRRIHKIDDLWTVEICPTYSGCPALDVIAMDAQMALDQAGFTNTKMKYVLDEPWTTDWITEEGKRKLKEYGIAPPVGSPDKLSMSPDDRVIPCPNCDSENTEM